MKKNLIPWLTKPSVYLFILACLFLGDLLFGGRIFLSRDAMSDFLPMRTFEADSLANGQLPFWNPYWGCGKPFIADTTSQALYPVNILFSIFKPVQAFNLYWLFHIYMAGLGVHFMCRQFDFSKTASSVAAISFMFGTTLIAQLEFPYNGVAMVWVPWIFGLIVRYGNAMDPVSRRPLYELWKQRRLVGLMALLFAVQFFANFPEMIIYPFIGYTLYIVAHGIVTRNWRLALSVILFVGAGGFLGLLITLPQLLPMWELVQYSERAGSFDTRFGMASVSWKHITTLIFPYIGGFPGFPDKFWERGLFEYWVGTFYVGSMLIATLPYALLAFSRRYADVLAKKRPWIVIALIMICVSLVLAMGENTFVYPWLHEHVPLMNRFRFPAKFLFIALIGIILLGAAGMDALLKTRPANGSSDGVEKFRKINPRNIKDIILALQFVFIVATGVMAFYIWKNPGVAPTFIGDPAIKPSQEALAKAGLYGVVTWLFLLAAFTWVFIAAKTRGGGGKLMFLAGLVAFASVFVVSRKIHPTGSGDILSVKPQIATTVSGTDYRVFSPYAGVQQYLYADPRLEMYEWAAQAGSGGMWLPSKISQYYQAATKFLKYKNMETLIYSKNQYVGARALDVCGVKWVLTGQHWQNILWGGAPRTLQVAERATAVPRFKLYDNWAHADTDEVVWERLSRGLVTANSLQVEPVALLGGKPATNIIRPPDANAGAGSIMLERKQNTRVVLTVNTPERSMLFFGDTYYPGWRARLDGHETPVNRVNYMFMGVEVPAGEHTIELWYYPRRFTLYVCVAMAALIATLAVIIQGWRKA